jgi:hypothetical protein
MVLKYRGSENICVLMLTIIQSSIIVWNIKSRVSFNYNVKSNRLLVWLYGYILSARKPSEQSKMSKFKNVPSTPRVLPIQPHVHQQHNEEDEEL